MCEHVAAAPAASVDDDEERTRALVLAARAGDRVAQDALLRQHLPRLRAFLRAQGGGRLAPRESEADLVQSVCREALDDLGGLDYQGAAAFRGWLFAVARNKLREKLRFHAAERRDPAREERPPAEAALGPGGLDSPSELAAGAEARAALEAALARLSPEHREVVRLARLEGLPHAEVARRMGRSEVAVRSLLSRALVALSGELGRGPDAAARS